MLAHNTKAVAAVIGHDLAGDREVEAVVVATALMGVHIALVELARTLALDGLAGDRLAEAIRTQGALAFDRLEEGLRDFGLKLDDTPSGARREREPPLSRPKSRRSSKAVR